METGCDPHGCYNDRGVEELQGTEEFRRMTNNFMPVFLHPLLSAHSIWTLSSFPP